MAELDKMVDGRARGRHVVDPGREDALAFETEQSDRPLELSQRRELRIVEDDARYQHAVDPLAHRHDVEEAGAAVLVAEVIEEQIETAVPKRALDRCDDLAEEPAIDERYDQPDGGGS